MGRVNPPHVETVAGKGREKGLPLQNSQGVASLSATPDGKTGCSRNLRAGTAEVSRHRVANKV